MKVAKKDQGERLDLFLRDRFPDCSRKQAKRWLDQGRVRINGRKTVIASWELKAGDEVEVVEGSEPEWDLSKFFLKVVYEDEDLLVVEKDAGISCETSPIALKPSLVQIINAYLLKQAPPNTRPYLGLIHRLDTDTSGLMVYTKKKRANTISRQFKEHTILRAYQAIVMGQVEKEQGMVRSFLEKSQEKGGAKVVALSHGSGQPAETEYRILERYNNASLIEARPKTGRTHQIRVHLAFIGHPLLGDKLYGEKKVRFKPSRHALHASRLGFKHPVTRKLLDFKSELPRDLRRLIDRLRVKG